MSATPTQVEFAAAWTDLQERINSGLDNLSVLLLDARANHGPAERTDHLMQKRSGLDDALTVWDGLHETARATGDYAHAWRSFTDSVIAAWRATQNASAKQGVALALDYQRGYGEDIDAPLFTVLASLPAGTVLRR